MREFTAYFDFEKKIKIIYVVTDMKVGNSKLVMKCNLKIFIEGKET